MTDSNAASETAQSGNSALRDAFLGGMSHAASTVNVITTDGQVGRAGVTVSAMSSVSADTPKPTLLVCVHRLSPAAQKIIDNGCFVVNVLRDDQSYISDTFSGRFKDQVADKFDCTEWVSMATGAPRVADPLVGFDCKVASVELVGTHYVFFGEVQEIYNSGRGNPLIYANRAYGSANRIESAQSIAAGELAASGTLSVGCFHSFGPSLLPGIIQKMSIADPDIRINLIEGNQRRLQDSLLAGETEVALMYDEEISDEIRYDVLEKLDLYVLLAKNDPLASRTELGPADLVDQPMVHLNGPPTRAFIADINQAYQRDPVIIHRPGSLEMARSMVAHGLGYTVLATKPAGTLSYDGKLLVTRPYVSANNPMKIVLAVRKTASLSTAAQKFVIFCQQFFAIDL